MMRFAFALPFLATPALADPEGYGPMMDWGHGYGMGTGPLMPLLTLILLVVAVVWLVRSYGAGTGRKATSALEELDLRLARGEIDGEDYTARKKLLTP